MKGQAALRYAIGFELVGLAIEAISVVKLGPITFMMFACLSLPCMIIGVLFYLRYLLSRLDDSERPTNQPGQA